MPTRIDINISLKLEILPNNKLIVPGCEPSSSLSSKTLSAWMARGGCGNALVDVNEALAAIPGSKVVLGQNYGRGKILQKWFVLPPIDTDCPCAQYDDFYDILRCLAKEDLPEETNFDACDVIGMGYCPSPDFDEQPPPPPDPYVEEGSFPPGVGILPPIPPWSIKPDPPCPPAAYTYRAVRVAESIKIVDSGNWRFMTDIGIDVGEGVGVADGDVQSMSVVDAITVAEVNTVISEAPDGASAIDNISIQELVTVSSELPPLGISVGETVGVISFGPGGP